jgi:uncharacterized protein (DUF433 family)
LGGTPVFKATRVPVSSLFNYLIDGKSVREFLIDYPSVGKSQVIDILIAARDILLK